MRVSGPLAGGSGPGPAMILRKAVARGPRRIITLTAQAMAGDEQKALAIGCDDHIAKPVVPRPRPPEAGAVDWPAGGLSRTARFPGPGAAWYANGSSTRAVSP